MLFPRDFLTDTLLACHSFCLTEWKRCSRQNFALKNVPILGWLKINSENFFLQHFEQIPSRGSKKCQLGVTSSQNFRSTRIFQDLPVFVFSNSLESGNLGEGSRSVCLKANNFLEMSMPKHCLFQYVRDLPLSLIILFSCRFAREHGMCKRNPCQGRSLSSHMLNKVMKV